MIKEKLFLLRHGDTAWTISGQHTSYTDIPLTKSGEEAAGKLGKRVERYHFDKVYSSPLKRAFTTCQLSGYQNPIIDDDLFEWNYGKYEGLTSTEIAKEDPSWSLYTDGGAEGETPEEVTIRADRFIEKIEESALPIAAFSSGHISRVIIARWLNMNIKEAMHFYLSPASLTILGYEKNNRVIITLNDTSHLF